MLSAICLNLDQSKIFSPCNGLIHSLINHFETVRNSKKLQTTTEIWLLKNFKIQMHRKHCGKGETAHF